MKRILVVEDQEANQYLLRALFAGNGFAVELAAHGAEALAKARQHPPDLIIADILMPVMDGFSLCREWKQDDRLKLIPFIFYTATYTDDRDRELALSLGAERFLIKPEEPEALLAIIRELTGEKVPPTAVATPAVAAPVRLPVEAPAEQETVYLKQYNQALVRKLEDKMEQLEKTNRALAQDIANRQRTEDKLRESEIKYRNLFESSRDALVTVDPASGRFTSGNPSALAVFGAKTEPELTAHGPADFSPERQPDGRLSAEKAREMDEVVLREGSHFFEWVHRRLGGEEFFADVLLTRIEQNGQPAILATVRDIAERKAAEQKLRESAARLAVIFHRSPLGIVIIRLGDGRIVDFNAAFADLHGYTRDELIGRSSDELKLWVTPAQRDEMIGQLHAHRSCKEYEIQSRKKSGEICDLVVSVELVELSGEPFALELVRDITERKRIAESHAQLATVVEQAAESIMITDAQGTILYANPAFEKTSGYARAEAVGQNPRLLKSGKHELKFYRELWEVIQRGDIWSGHFINRRKNGALYEEEATISPVRDPAGKIVNFVAVKRDVTREVQLEAQYRQAQKMEAIGTLAGGIAHDFNNVLSAIFGYGYLLEQDTAENPDTHENVVEILKAANRAKELVRQILTFSRQREQNRQIIPLDSIVKEATKFLRASLPAEIQIEIKLAADAPTVLADATQIYQVTVNLATNALHAMEGRPGRLTVALESFVPDENFIETHPDSKATHYARLTVADTGCGMDAKTLERIYEPFFTTKPIGKGTGLGLAVVHGIVKAHDGLITVESEVGKGTTFRLYFPAQTNPGALTEGAANQLATGHGQKILLLDDEPAVTASLQKLLVRLDYQVTRSNSAREALARFRANPAGFDLLITDLTLPEMNGLEVTRQIHEIRRHLPVILISGYTPDLNQDALHAAGICERLAKPVDLAHLADAVQRALATTRPN